MPKPLLDVNHDDDPFNVGAHIKSYVYDSQRKDNSHLTNSSPSKDFSSQLRQKLQDMDESRSTQSDGESSFSTWDSVSPEKVIYDQVALEEAHSSRTGQATAAQVGRGVSARARSDSTPPPLPPRDYGGSATVEQVSQMCLWLRIVIVLHRVEDTHNETALMNWLSDSKILKVAAVDLVRRACSRVDILSAVLKLFHNNSMHTYNCFRHSVL